MATAAFVGCAAATLYSMSDDVSVLTFYSWFTASWCMFFVMKAEAA